MFGRIIDSGVCDPPSVMARDEVFLTLASQDREPPPVIHFYRKTPSVCLGYFQSVERAVDTEACRELGVGIFRRKSGGGTIYEDPDQLIYGLILPRPGDLGVPADIPASFRHLNSAVQSVLRKLGFRAEYKPVNDILVNGRKVSGCAQRRLRGSLLQHGTIILRYDPVVMFRVLKTYPGKASDEPARVVTSLEREAPPDMDPANLTVPRIMELMVHHISVLLGVEFRPDSLTQRERELSDELARETYGSDSWTHRR